MDLMLLLMAGLGLAAVVGVLGDNDDGSEEDVPLDDVVEVSNYVWEEAIIS